MASAGALGDTWDREGYGPQRPLNPETSGTLDAGATDFALRPRLLPQFTRPGLVSMHKSQLEDVCIICKVVLLPVNFFLPFYFLEGKIDPFIRPSPPPTPPPPTFKVLKCKIPVPPIFKKHNWKRLFCPWLPFLIQFWNEENWLKTLNLALIDEVLSKWAEYWNRGLSFL